MASRLALGLFVGMAMVCVWPDSGEAGQVALSPSSVIGGNGSWNGNPFNVGQFQAGNVADLQPGAGVPIAEPDQTPGDADGGFWLGDQGQVGEYFVLDLGQQTGVERVELYNTHNATFNDRATADFQIEASNAVAFVGASLGFDLVGGVSIINDTLAFQPSANDPIEPESFTPTIAGPWQYLKFTAISGPSDGVGLNEIQVFAAIPEPSTCVLAAMGLFTAGYFGRRRRRLRR